MPRTGPALPELTLTDGEREQLECWARPRKPAQDLALRARIVVECATGASNAEVARRLSVSIPTVRKWRTRFLEDRLDGLADGSRPGRPPLISMDRVERVIIDTLESTPSKGTHWSRAKMAERSGLSKSTVGRIWKSFGLKPHLQEGFKFSTHPLFTDKVYDIVGLYLNPPEWTVVLCVDEKSQVKDLAWPQSKFPIRSMVSKRRSHDYARRHATNLFSPMNMADGMAISAAHRRHRAVEFKNFLVMIEKAVPDGLDVYIVCGNYSTYKNPSVISWLAKHPRFHANFTLTYLSWINQVERLFTEATQELIQRCEYRTIQALENDLRGWVSAWNEQPHPFMWTKSTEDILSSIAQFMKRINHEDIR